MKIIFLGGQGSGKSTQAKLLSGKLQLPYIEMGQLLRERAEKPDKLGLQIKRTLEKGHLVENEITINLLKNEIKTNKYQNGYILDGYPRNNIQLEALKDPIDFVFYIKVSGEDAIKRLSMRKRSDDKDEVLAKRLEIYHEQTEPLLDKFRQRKILKEVEGERPIEAIHKDILNIVNNFNPIANV